MEGVPSYGSIIKIAEGIKNLSALLDRRGPGLILESDTFRIQNHSKSEIVVRYTWEKYANKSTIRAMFAIMFQPWKWFRSNTFIKIKDAKVAPGHQIDIQVRKQRLGWKSSAQTDVICFSPDWSCELHFHNNNQIPSYNKPTVGLGDKNQGVRVEARGNRPCSLSVDPIKSIDSKKLAGSVTSIVKNEYKSKRYPFTSYLYEIKVRES